MEDNHPSFPYRSFLQSSHNLNVVVSNIAVFAMAEGRGLDSKGRQLQYVTIGSTLGCNIRVPEEIFHIESEP